MLFTRWRVYFVLLAAFLTQTVSLDDVTVKFEIWDTAGQERYHSLAPMYYRGAQAAIVVYDITNTVSRTCRIGDCKESRFSSFQNGNWPENLDSFFVRLLFFFNWLGWWITKFYSAKYWPQEINFG